MSAPATKPGNRVYEEYARQGRCAGCVHYGLPGNWSADCMAMKAEWFEQSPLDREHEASLIRGAASPQCGRYSPVDWLADWQPTTSGATVPPLSA